jgi:hypothetical protein
MARWSKTIIPTTVTFTPGFRGQVGAGFYLLDSVEVPVTDATPYDYRVLAGLIKVW